MAQYQLFEPGTVPECATAEWYAERDAAPHLEQEGHRERLLLTADMVAEARFDTDGSFCDLGAGDGGLLSLLPNLHRLAWGYDLQQANVDAARVRRVDVRLRDVVADFPSDADTEVLVATEFLEHLVDPHAFVKRCFDTAATGLVASSPYTETPESHYEHHLWAFDDEGYRALIEGAGWKIIRHEHAWISQVVLAVKP